LEYVPCTARLPCQFQPVQYAIGLVIVLAAGLVAPAPAARADPSGPWWTKNAARADPSGPWWTKNTWWTKNNGAIITVAPCAAFIAYCGILLLLKGPVASTFDWTPEGVARKMNAACRHPGIEYSEGAAI
jgi:hypothetical protein